MDVMAEEGRVTDDVMAHLTTGEIVVPVHIAQNKQAVAMLTMMFELAGADVDEFTVGNVKNKINPETGHPEFWGGFFGSVIKAVAAPVSTAVNTVSNVVQTVGNTVSNVVDTAGSTASKVTKDVINLNPVAAVKDTVVGANTVATQTVTGTGTALNQLASGATQTAKDVVGAVANIAATTASTIGLAPKPQAPKQPGPAATSDTTLTQNQELRNTSLTDPAAVGGGGVSSTSTRTVAGPDNEYKLNKNTMIGL